MNAAPREELQFNVTHLLPIRDVDGDVGALRARTSRACAQCNAARISAKLECAAFIGLVRLRVKRASGDMERIFDTMAKKGEAAESSGEASPFSEITEEDIDALFSE